MKNGPVSFVEGPMCKHPKFQRWDGAGILFLGAGEVFVPIEKAVAIKIAIP